MSTEKFAVSDVEYNLITTLSNLLQAEDVLQRYADDAQQAGETEVAAIFRELGDSNNQFSRRMKEKLHAQFMNE